MLQFGQFVSHGADGVTDLPDAVIGGDKEAKAGGVIRHCRGQNGQNIDAAIEQGVRQCSLTSGMTASDNNNIVISVQTLNPVTVSS